MAHGHADHGLGMAKRTIHAVADLGELAARLGSIDTFDRRGDIVWYDDFEALFNKWAPIVAADIGSVIQSDYIAKRGTHSLELTTGPVAGGATGVYHEEGYPVLSNFGFEAHFHLYHDTIRAYIEARIFTGTQRLRTYLVYERDNSRWRYLDHNGIEQDLLLGVTYPARTTLFVPCKFVIDITNRTYLRGIFSNQEVDMSAFGVQVTPDLITVPHLQMRILAHTPLTPAQRCYFDNVIITQNEP